MITRKIFFSIIFFSIISIVIFGCSKASKKVDSSPFKVQGSFSWNELMTPDVEGSKSFYGNLFGWTIKDEPVENMTYSVISINNVPVGGIMKTPPEAEGAPPNWGVYVTVDDVDALTAKAKELGGSILVMPGDIPDVGRFSVIRDPQGAYISLITYIKK